MNHGSNGVRPPPARTKPTHLCTTGHVTQPFWRPRLQAGLLQRAAAAPPNSQKAKGLGEGIQKGIRLRSQINTLAVHVSLRHFNSAHAQCRPRRTQQRAVAVAMAAEKPRTSSPCASRPRLCTSSESSKRTWATPIVRLTPN